MLKRAGTFRILVNNMALGISEWRIERAEKHWSRARRNSQITGSFTSLVISKEDDECWRNKLWDDSWEHFPCVFIWTNVRGSHCLAFSHCVPLYLHPTLFLLRNVFTANVLKLMNQLSDVLVWEGLFIFFLSSSFLHSTLPSFRSFVFWRRNSCSWYRTSVILLLFGEYLFLHLKKWFICAWVIASISQYVISERSWTQVWL